MNEYYLFPFGEVKRGSRIVLYGTGVVGKDYIKQIYKTNYCNIVYAVDSFLAEGDSKTLCIDGKKIDVYSPKRLKEKTEYDVIIIATIIDKYVEEIKEKIKNEGINEKNIVASPVIMYGNTDSYSQHGEDRIVYNAFCHMGYFRDGKLPSYIDIGAHDPYFISNTALFYHKGCRGINVEANPELITKFEKERPDDINLCVGVGAEPGTFPFYMCNVSGLNTFKKENIIYNERLVEIDTGKRGDFPIEKTVELPVLTIPQIIESYSNSIWPDYLSIDIEGMEYDSLKICNFDNGPRIISCEVNLDGDKFVKLMDEKGYYPYLWYRENIIFARNDMKKSLQGC